MGHVARCLQPAAKLVPQQQTSQWNRTKHAISQALNFNQTQSTMPCCYQYPLHNNDTRIKPPLCNSSYCLTLTLRQHKQHQHIPSPEDHRHSSECSRWGLH